MKQDFVENIAYFKNKMEHALRVQNPRAAEDYRLKMLLLEDTMKIEKSMKKRKKT